MDYDLRVRIKFILPIHWGNQFIQIPQDEYQNDQKNKIKMHCSASKVPKLTRQT